MSEKHKPVTIVNRFQSGNETERRIALTRKLALWMNASQLSKK